MDFPFMHGGLFGSMWGKFKYFFFQWQSRVTHYLGPQTSKVSNYGTQQPEHCIEGGQA